VQHLILDLHFDLGVGLQVQIPHRVLVAAPLDAAIMVLMRDIHLTAKSPNAVSMYLGLPAMPET
jgi:hypothetical protein